STREHRARAAAREDEDRPVPELSHRRSPSETLTATLEQDVAPRGHYRMPGAGRDGVLRRRGRALVRAIHHGDDCAVVAAWATGGGVRLRASGPSRDAAAYGIERMRYALGVDHDLAPFHERFARDRLLGPI